MFCRSGGAWEGGREAGRQSELVWQTTRPPVYRTAILSGATILGRRCCCFVKFPDCLCWRTKRTAQQGMDCTFAKLVSLREPVKISACSQRVVCWHSCSSPCLFYGKCWSPCLVKARVQVPVGLWQVFKSLSGYSKCLSPGLVMASVQVPVWLRQSWWHNPNKFKGA